MVWPRTWTWLYPADSGSGISRVQMTCCANQIPPPLRRQCDRGGIRRGDAQGKRCVSANPYRGRTNPLDQLATMSSALRGLLVTDECPDFPAHESQSRDRLRSRRFKWRGKASNLQPPDGESMEVRWHTASSFSTEPNRFFIRCRRSTAVLG